MASELQVQTISGPPTGANANKILLGSGQQIVAPAGGLVAPGQVIQVVQLQMGTISTTSTSFNYNTFNSTYTPISSTSKLLLQYNMGAYTDVDNDAQGANNGLATYEYQIGSGSWNVLSGNYQIISGRGGNGQQNFFQWLLTPNTSSAITFRCGIKSNDGNGRTVHMRGDLGGANTLVIQEIAS